jgi:ERCC4-type nuclease
VLIQARGRWHGIQRKELKDLLASLQDGRLSRELMMMKRCGEAKLLIEGRPHWTQDGELVLNQWSQRFTISQMRGLIWSVQSQGVGTLHTTGLQDTIETVRGYERWLLKDKHHSLLRRPGPVSVWGRPENRDYAMHLVQGIPGVGPELAGRIVDKFGVPFGWKVSEEDLLLVPGIGKKKARMLMRALDDQTA